MSPISSNEDESVVVRPSQNSKTSASSISEQHSPQINVVPLLDDASKQTDDRLDASTRAKVNRVLAACQGRDLQTLRELAVSKGGLVNDSARRSGWPILLGCEREKYEDLDWSSLPPHRDEQQVDLDVNRSFVYYPADEPDSRLDVRKRELSDVIKAVLRRHPMLHYFQGYHDIAQVLLLVLGAKAVLSAVARLSLLHIRDFLLPTMTASEAHIRLIPAILCAADFELYQHLTAANRPAPFFALAATLTLYAHDIEEYATIARLYDYLLASEAAVPLYLFVAIILSRKSTLLSIPSSDPDMLYFMLSKLPQPLDVEALISQTEDLLHSYPPPSLPFAAWRSISAHSVLKTTRASPAKQTIADAEVHFARLAAEIRRSEARKRLATKARALARRYRRPATWAGAAVLVAFVALYFGRSGGSSSASWVSSSPIVQAARERIGDLFQRVVGRIA